MDNQEKIKTGNEEKEVDMGVFLNLLSKFFGRVGNAIKYSFISLFNGVIYLLLFIKKGILWLLIGAVIGVSFGLYTYFNGGAIYYSDMAVKTNFESSRLLYQKIDYFNALIHENRLQDLMVLFNINQTTAAQLRSFQIEPIKDPLQVSALYKRNYLDYKRNNTFSADTIWTRTMQLKNFEQQLTKYDYPMHSIRLKSGNSTIFPRIQQGIIQSMKENPALLYAKEVTEKMIRDEERILSSSIEGIDSLRSAYNKRISEKSDKADPPNLLITQSSTRSPEIDLYDKTLLLKDELTSIRKRSIEQKEIIQVYADFNKVGTRVSKFNSSILDFSWKGSVIAFTVLAIIQLFRDLNAYEKNKDRNRMN